MNGAARRQALSLALFLALPLATGALGAVASTPGEWYAGLAKPAWNPPSWVFGPVWTTLYLLMGLAAWLVWRERASKPVAGAMWLFGGQLLVNGAWSWLFFEYHLIALALADLLLLLVVVALLTMRFWSVRPVAGILLLPYLTWVGFAALLNGAIWLLNS